MSAGKQVNFSILPLSLDVIFIYHSTNASAEVIFMAKKMVCECGPVNFLWVVVSAAVLAVGLMLVVQGVSMQWTGAVTLESFLWDGLGLLVIMIGKYFKMKAGEGCSMHGMC